MPNPPAPPPASSPETGAKLVRASRWLLLGGLVTCFAGCGLGMALKIGVIAILGGAAGFAVIVAAAVVGQVGRGYQGRVI